MGGCQTGGDAEGVAASRGSDIYLSEQQSQEAKNYGYWCFPVLTRECRPDWACRCHSMSLCLDHISPHFGSFWWGISRSEGP